MKLLIIFAIANFCIVSTWAKGIDQKKLKNQIQIIREAQDQGQHEEIMRLTQQLVLNIHRGLEMDEVKKVIRDKFTEVRREVVERSERYSKKASGSAFFGLFGGGASYSKEWGVDYTTIITTNPRAAANFKGRVQRNWSSLNQYLLDYMRSYYNEIIVMKLAAMIYIDSATEILDQGGKIYIEDAVFLSQLVQDIHFIGRHEVTTCIKTHYRERESYSRTKGSAGVFSLFGFGARAGFSEERRTIFPARTEVECSSDINTARVTPQQDVYSLSLSQLDRQMMEMINFLGLKLKLEGEGLLFPTFGNPWYE